MLSWVVIVWYIKDMETSSMSNRGDRLNEDSVIRIKKNLSLPDLHNMATGLTYGIGSGLFPWIKWATNRNRRPS